MKMPVTRRATVDNINSFLKRSQEADDTALEETPPEEVVEGEEALEEEKPPLEERVEELEEKQEVIEEALEEHKDVIENIMEVEEGEGHTFEDWLDGEDKKKEDEEISNEEMGLDDEFLTAGEEENMSLREQRKARLSGKKAAEKTETLADQWDYEKAKKERSGPIQPEVTQGKVPEHKMPDMFKVGDLSLELTDDKKAWIVLDKNEKPICAIKQGTVKAEEFASQEFAKKVILDMHKLGVRSALKKYKAEGMPAKSAVKPAGKPADKKIAATDNAAALKAANNNFKRRFVRALRLALTAMNKNLVKPVPLKAAFFEILSSLSVPHANEIIETAFQKAGIKHFETAIANAEKYLGMADSAFIELESSINDIETAEVPVSIEEEEAIHEHAADLRRRARAGSMPFDTKSEEDVNDRMAILDRVLPKPKLASLKGMFSNK